MLGLSFAFAVGPPANATRAELIAFAQQHFVAVLWGAWLQAVGPVFIILFALALVQLSSATLRLSGWMTLFGGSVLMTVSLIEITYYISALFPEPEMMGSISQGASGPSQSTRIRTSNAPVIETASLTFEMARNAFSNPAMLAPRCSLMSIYAWRGRPNNLRFSSALNPVMTDICCKRCTRSAVAFPLS
jgi:hypothetical protein